MWSCMIFVSSSRSSVLVFQGLEPKFNQRINSRPDLCSGGADRLVSPRFFFDVCLMRSKNASWHALTKQICCLFRELNGNGLIGTIPSEMSTLVKLVILYISKSLSPFESISRDHILFQVSGWQDSSSAHWDSSFCIICVDQAWKLVYPRPVWNWLNASSQWNELKWRWLLIGSSKALKSNQSPAARICRALQKYENFSQLVKVRP